VEGCSTNNHIIQTLPREIREGVTVAIIEDPDGNLIELMQDDNL
jgi:predicted enzyme related to lactoylglutathione lyase